MGLEPMASDKMVWGLVSRIERFGHFLSPSQVDKIHMMLDDATQTDQTLSGTQTEAAKAIRERMDREP